MILRLFSVKEKWIGIKNLSINFYLSKVKEILKISLKTGLITVKLKNQPRKIFSKENLHIC